MIGLGEHDAVRDFPLAVGAVELDGGLGTGLGMATTASSPVTVSCMLSMRSMSSDICSALVVAESSPGEGI